MIWALHLVYGLASPDRKRKRYYGETELERGREGGRERGREGKREWLCIGIAASYLYIVIYTLPVRH